MGHQPKDTSDFVGYQLVEFGQPIRRSLQEVADRLMPNENEIVTEWIQLQFSTWQPPGFTREQLQGLFGDLLHGMLVCMKALELETCINYLEQLGADMARRNFPYQALIISFHFLEESYNSFLFNPPSENTLRWMIAMDEFLHAALAAIATSYFEAQRKELLEEAEVGRIVQEGLLPDIPKTVFDIDVASIYLPSGERARIGGDLIDLFTIDDQRAAFILGDISGHGLEAATDAVLIRSLFRGFIRENAALADVFGRLNRVLAHEFDDGRFATAIAGLVSALDEVTLVNAGHPPVVFCKGACTLLEPGGIVLAVGPESTYSVHEITLPKGALLVAYTDGLTEARSEDGSFFGEERLVAAIEEVRDAPARAIAGHLRDEALRFANGKLIDDTAILVLKRR
ncbi:MAG TPA: PP2C family protein-serine/threonine phosphatase [Candidatus Aquicultor sp.]|jgi:serine phosphatase RsbU (regulator of sigma subunit)